MSLLINKFPYQNLERETLDGIRYYQCPCGLYPSVTSILSATKSEESRATLAAWRDRIGHERAQQIVTASASRGTRMHSYLEDYVLTGQLKEPGSNPYSRVANLMAETIIKQGLSNVDEYWGSEVNLYYPGLYSGTTDLVGVWKGREAILDFKQSNKPKLPQYVDDYRYQLVSYGLCHNHLYGTDIKTGVILVCVQPQVDDQMNIIQEPVYQEFVIKDDEWDQYVELWWNRVEQFYLHK